jgi:hypothetical protein
MDIFKKQFVHFQNSFSLKYIYTCYFLQFFIFLSSWQARSVVYFDQPQHAVHPNTGQNSSKMPEKAANSYKFEQNL